MNYRKLPKLVIFDLDYTLWPFWVDTHVTPPFRVVRNAVVDNRGMKVRFYPDVPQVLEKLTNMGCEIGIASRTSEAEGANQLIDLFQWTKYFKYKEIYPGTKVKHFQEFKKQSNLEYSDMLFFDDEYRNIEEVGSELDVICVLVENGMTLKELDNGLKTYEEKSE